MTDEELVRAAHEELASARIFAAMLEVSLEAAEDLLAALMRRRATPQG